MNDLFYSKLISAFRLTCWTATAILLCYWIYFFSLDEDICIVDYKEYYDTPTHRFPMLSLCLKNPFRKDYFITKDDKINPESYLNFLKGNYYTTEMVNISYNTVILNMSDHFSRFWIEWRNGSSETSSTLKNLKSLFQTSYSGFWRSNFYNCYSLPIPQDKNIMAFQVELRNNIFQSGIRDRNFSILTLLHTHNQFLTAGKTIKFMFPLRRENDSYVTRFKIKGVEMIKRRNKRSQKCHENWSNFDSVILEEHAKKVGCTPPYHESIHDIPICSTKDEMRMSKFTLRFDGYGSPPPCEGIEKIYYSFEEDKLEGTIWDEPGKFWIGPFIYDPKFKEIIQKRAIDIHSLVGYIGGYIGLFLGYSIIQIPDFLTVIIRRYRSYFVKKEVDVD